MGPDPLVSMAIQQRAGGLRGLIRLDIRPEGDAVREGVMSRRAGWLGRSGFSGVDVDRHVSAVSDLNSLCATKINPVLSCRAAFWVDLFKQTLRCIKDFLIPISATGGKSFLQRAGPGVGMSFVGLQYRDGINRRSRWGGSSLIAFRMMTESGNQ
jgi:hypothetical protein